MEFQIRNPTKKDLADIINICYRTGWNGEDLTGTGKFNDKKLFGYLFCSYYPLYEPEHSFIAIDKQNNNVVGYILGTPNTVKQEKSFKTKMSPRIMLRTFLLSSWKYHESFSFIMRLRKNIGSNTTPKDFLDTFPAHLHIDILPEYQKKGIGSALIKKFEYHMIELSIKGIHLGTSSKNVKALPFYKKHGYNIYAEHEGSLWANDDDNKGITFIKKL